MSTVINTNIPSLNAQRNLTASQSSLTTSLQRLSSGLRINSAKDDAAGMAISERMTAQIQGLNQAARNANDGISLAQTAEGAIGQTSDALQRIRELAIQSANSTNSATDRTSLQSEANQLKQEIDRIASTTEFNGLKLLDGTFNAQSFQVGANASQSVSVTVAGASTSHLANNSINAVNLTPYVGTSSATFPAASVGTGGIATQTLTVSGMLGSTTVSVGSGDSAYTVAAAISAKEASTGVTARSYNSVRCAGLTADGTVTMTIGSGGSTATISAAVTTTDLSALAVEINKVTGTTGISATASGGTLVMIQSEGKNINVGDFTDSTAGTGLGFYSTDAAGNNVDGIGLWTGTAQDSSVFTGYVAFNSNSSFAVSSSISAAAGSILNVAANTSVGSSQSLLSAINISSVSGAQSAIVVIDAALNTVNGIRANLGAIQNRFSSMLSNLQTTSENLSAARSRIRDADFAAETATLTRAQILQQAGTAMLAQANSLPQSVLSLLK